MVKGTITKIIEATPDKTVCEIKLDEYQFVHGLTDRTFIGTVQSIGNETRKDKITEQIKSLLGRQIEMTVIPSDNSSIFIEKW
ncbi:MAG: hypothetical protein HY063_11805 [Bacteroidetes bacterium]|nr:hypothetical protein [Bacteroidota bacterium]